MKKNKDKSDKKSEKSDQVDALQDIGIALAKVFKRYTLTTRKRAWKRINSPKGEKTVEKLIRFPGRPSTIFRSLFFKEWLDQQEDS